MTWKVWLQGLAAAAVGGAATGGTQALSSGVSLKGTGMAAAAGALVTVLAYLAKSPLGGNVPPADPPKAQ